MFSYERDASKIALMHLSARLIHGGFTLLDTQFVTQHLRQFGALEVDRAGFHKRLELALVSQGNFLALPLNAPPDQVVAIIQANTRAH